MKKEWARDWSKALRSGKYRQTKHQLKIVDDLGPYYCCLGVLTELAGLECHNYKYLPQEVRDITEIKSNSGSFIDSEGHTSYLAFLNDNDFSFPEIADIIDTHWRDL